MNCLQKLQSHRHLYYIGLVAYCSGRERFTNSKMKFN